MLLWGRLGHLDFSRRGHSGKASSSQARPEARQEAISWALVVTSGRYCVTRGVLCLLSKLIHGGLPSSVSVRQPEASLISKRRDLVVKRILRGFRFL